MHDIIYGGIYDWRELKNSRLGLEVAKRFSMLSVQLGITFQMLIKTKLAFLAL